MDDLKELEQDFNRISNFQHISYKDKIQRACIELSETDPTKILKRGWEEWDNTLGGIYGGKLYVIGAETGTGKTTFVNQVCKNVSRTGVKVVKYSLEDRIEDIGKEELYYTMNRLRHKDQKPGYQRIKFVNNELKGEEFMEYVGRAVEELLKENIIELDKKKQVTIDDLTALMDEECDKGAKLFAIDHLHYFEFDKGGDRLDLQIQNVMHRINEIARKRNVAILLVAHYRNNVNKTGQEPDPSWFKDGASIKQVANIIIQIVRDEEKSLFYISKLRGPITKPVFECKFDIGTYEYSFKKSQDQKLKEEKNILTFK